MSLCSPNPDIHTFNIKSLLAIDLTLQRALLAVEFTEVEVERVAIALEHLGGEVDGFHFALTLQQLCEERLLISLLLVLQGLLNLEPSLLVLPAPADLH